MYSNYGGYGSGYLGSSYGGYSSYGAGTGYNSYGGMNSPGVNNFNNANQDPRKQQPDARRQFMEEYFKMMGGLQSMIQIGFSMVSFGAFANMAWKVLKKIVLFLLKTSTSFTQKIISLFSKDSKMNELWHKLMMVSPHSKNSNNKILAVLRVFAILIIAVSYVLQGRIAKESAQKKQELLKQYKETKQKQQMMELQQNQLYGEEIPRQKEGFI